MRLNREEEGESVEVYMDGGCLTIRTHVHVCVQCKSVCTLLIY